MTLVETPTSSAAHFEEFLAQSRYSRHELKLVADGVFPGLPRLPDIPTGILDRIVEITNTGGAYGKGYVIAEIDVGSDNGFFKGHFNDDPVMPGLLGVDALMQALGFWLGRAGARGKGRARGLDSTTFLAEILPGTGVVQLRVDVRTRIINKRMSTVEGDGRIYQGERTFTTASNLKVIVVPN